MLLSTVEFYILSEFKNRGVVRLNNETRHTFFSRRFRHRNRDSTLETGRAYAGKEIDTSEIIKNY